MCNCVQCSVVYHNAVHRCVVWFIAVNTIVLSCIVQLNSYCTIFCKEVYYEVHAQLHCVLCFNIKCSVLQCIVVYCRLCSYMHFRTVQLLYIVVNCTVLYCSVVYFNLVMLYAFQCSVVIRYCSEVECQSYLAQPWLPVLITRKKV